MNERKQAIEEMVEVYGTNPNTILLEGNEESLCGDLYDAGYRKKGESNNSYNAALSFALDELSNGDDTRVFLELWREGCWPEIAQEFSEFNLETTGQCDKHGGLLITDPTP